MKKALFEIEPLTCPSCTKKIEGALNKMAGIVSTRVLFNLGKVRVEFDEAYIDIGQLEKLLRKLRYSITAAKLS